MAKFQCARYQSGLSRYTGEFTRPQSLSVVAKSVLIEGSPRINTTSSL